MGQEGVEFDKSIEMSTFAVGERGRRHTAGFLYSVKPNREIRETRSANFMEFRAIIFPPSIPTFASGREPLHAPRVSRPRAASLSFSRLSRKSGVLK